MSGSPSEQRRVLTRASVWLPLTLLLLGLPLLWLYGSQPGVAAAGTGERPSVAVPVVTTQVAKGVFRVYLDALGSVVPANSVVVRSRVDGQLLRLHFTEGQQVRAGQLLAEIDPRPFEVLLTQARGQLARDEALLKNARLDQQRYDALSGKGSIPQQTVNAQEALVEQYQGVVEVSRGVVGHAELQLDYTRISAPIDGRVGLRLIDPGNMIRGSDASGLVVISQLQPAQVVFTLPEDALPRLLPKLAGDDRLRVEVYDRSLSNRLAEGELLTVDNQIDASTGTVRVKAEFANEDEVLFPNQFVNVRLLLQTLPAALLIPADAVHRGLQGDFVYVVDEHSSVHIQSVTLGPAEDGQVVVNRGLEAGQTIVVDGVDRLRAGTLVAPVPTPAGSVSYSLSSSSPSSSSPSQSPSATGP